MCIPMLPMGWLPRQPMASPRSLASRAVESISTEVLKQWKPEAGPEAVHFVSHTALGHATTCSAVLYSSTAMMAVSVSAQVL